MIDLPFVLFSERNLLPSTPGIYIVADDRTVFYVGRARDLRMRWGNHHRAAQMIDAYRIHWQEVPAVDLRWTERDFIKRLQPRWNTTLTRRGRDLLDLLPRKPREQVAALMRTFDSEARDVIVRAIAELWQREVKL